jgi:hypothetical protein
MKIIMTAIAALGAMTTFVGSAFADVSFTIRFGSSPSVTTYRTYDSYRSNIYQPTYQDPYYRYNHHHNDHSRVIVREIVPNYNYGNSWNYPNVPVNVPNVNYPANFPTRGSVYNPYNYNLGDRYIVEQRFIRVR